MALLHQADLQPTKLELLAVWLPTRSWYQGPATPDLKRAAAYRFDDPAGEVGIETILVQADGGPVYQVPLTYRGAPLDGADRWLIGTTEHSVLGRRWVYDATGDPVYARTLASTILTGGEQAEEFVDKGGRLERREPIMSVRGSGSHAGDPAVDSLVRVDDADPAVIVADGVELTVARILDGTGGALAQAPGAEQLIGTWGDQATPLILALAQPR
jgi:hypothetical protein